MTDAAGRQALYLQLGELDPTWHPPDTPPRPPWNVNLTIPWDATTTARALIDASCWHATQHTRRRICVDTANGLIVAVTPIPLPELGRIAAASAIDVDRRLRDGKAADLRGTLPYPSLRGVFADPRATLRDAGRARRIIENQAAEYLEQPQFGTPVPADPTIELLATLLRDQAPVYGDIATNTDSISRVITALVVTLEKNPDLLAVAQAETRLAARTLGRRPVADAHRSIP
jgi:hypothetical protein